MNKFFSRRPVFLTFFVIGAALTYVAWELSAVNPNKQVMGNQGDQYQYQAIAAMAGAVTAVFTGLFGLMNAYFDFRKARHEAETARHELDAIRLSAKGRGNQTKNE